MYACMVGRGATRWVVEVVVVVVGVQVRIMPPEISHYSFAYADELQFQFFA